LTLAYRSTGGIARIDAVMVAARADRFVAAE
jgi:hypothetical protein